MRSTFAALFACSFIAFAAAEASAQVYYAPAPQGVYRPALSAYSYPSVVVNRPAVVVAPTAAQAPVVTQPHAVNQPAPTVAGYAPAAAAPVITQYAPAAHAPAVVSQPAQVVTHAPITAAPYASAPVVTAPPVAAYRPALLLYRQPIVTYRQPVVTYRQPGATYAAPVNAGYAVPVARPVIISPKVYYPGQPIRNVLRAITP